VTLQPSLPLLPLPLLPLLRLCSDNLLPYALVRHIHEREIGFHCGAPVAFMPHVAPFFQGISLTVSAHVKSATGAAGAYRPRARALAHWALPVA